MLDCLHIQNIAVIENADIKFSSGFNVITGETGAGKSILIDSLNAVLGARTSKELIRNDSDSACVVAEFSQIDRASKNILDKYGINYDDDKVILQRILTSDNRGGCRINGQPTTTAVMREVGKYLVNIHGQHDNQDLLDAGNHFRYIDILASNDNLRDAYYSEFKILNSIRKELKELEMDEDEKLRRKDILQYQINELENANINCGEYEKLKEKSRLAREFEKSVRSVSFASESLSGDDAPGIIESLKSAIKALNSVDLQKARDIVSRFESALECLYDADFAIRDLLDNDLSENLNAEEIDNRLDLLRSLMLKYGNSEEKILCFLDDARTKLQSMNSAEERITQLESELLSSQDRLIKLGEKLTFSRKKSALQFQKDVCSVLTELNMPQVMFSVQMSKGKYSKYGCDIVEFMISTNAGEGVKPLAKIASGGELSRIMLAIKSVLSHCDEIGTLIFDEIDSGISGRAAIKVAEQLANVAKNRQVICVTHLAQIAAYGAKHMLIEKNVHNKKTFTNVIELDYEQRIAEIARIMAGTDITGKLFDSAKELLDRSNTNENL